jgi:spermidine/putrescine-binding protein
MEGLMTGAESKKVDRRSFLKYAATVVATGVVVGAATYYAAPRPKEVTTVTVPGAATTVTKTVTVAGTPTTVTTLPTITPPPAKPKELRLLMWEAYWVPEIIKPFEEKYGVTLRATWFDENSEVFARLKAGGWRDFDIVMGDAFWPALYGENGWCIPVDTSRLKNFDRLFPAFRPPFPYVYEGKVYASPNCWGGYGITSHKKYVTEEEGSTILGIYNDKFKGHVAISERSQENIALAGILAGYYLNWKLDPKYGPWRLTDEQLDVVKELLLYQKSLLMARYISVSELAKWLQEETAWIAPDWFDGFGLAYQAGVPVRYQLFPKEGGLGWVDGYAITKGVEGDEEKYDLCHKWLDWILEPENQLKLLRMTGHSVVTDITDMLTEEEIMMFNMTKEQAEKWKKLWMFQAPDRPDVWEKVFSDVLALPPLEKPPEWLTKALKG